MIYARQSTAIIVTVGPVLDASGAAVTDCVVADFKVSKNGGAPAALNGSATLTHRFTGQYSLSLTATDVNTVGTAEICIDDTTNTCGIKEIQIVEPAVYDAFYADAATGAVPIATNGLSLASVNADAHILFGIIESGTAQSASATGIVLRAGASFADNTLVGATVFVYGSTQGYWQERVITANALSGDTVTVDTWNQTPSGTISYYIFGTAPGSESNPMPVNVEQWLGSAVAASLVAGYPRVDVTYGNGVALGLANSLSINGANVGDRSFTGVAGPGTTYTGASGHAGTRHVGTAAGHGLHAVGGTSSNTAGIFGTTAASAGFGVQFTGVGSRSGIQSNGGASGGSGLNLVGGSASGAALTMSNTSGDVLTITGTSTIGATTVGSLTVAGAVTLSGLVTLTTGLTVSGDTTLNNINQSGTVVFGAVTVTDFTNFGDTILVGTTTLTGAVTATNASNDIRVNVTKVNSVTLEGTGVLGDEWGPA